MSADDIGITFLLLGRDGRRQIFPVSQRDIYPGNVVIKEGVLGA